MSVAIISVIASASITLASLAFTYRQGREQRKHEAAQAFEARAFDLKVDAHLRLIEIASAMKRRSDIAGEVALAAWDDLLAVKGDVQPTVLAYGSDGCQVAVENLIKLLEVYTPQVEFWTRSEVAELRRLKEEAIEAKTFEKAATIRAKEVGILSNVVSVFVYDPVFLNQRADEAIKAARESLRGAG